MGANDFPSFANLDKPPSIAISSNGGASFISVKYSNSSLKSSNLSGGISISSYPSVHLKTSGITNPSSLSAGRINSNTLK